MKGDDLSERLIDYAVRIIKLVKALPKTFIGKHIGIQLLKPGTSPGANYEEARGSESQADFIHKMGIVLKEFRESSFWLKVILRSKLIPQKLMKNIIHETVELCNIIASSIKAARRKK